MSRYKIGVQLIVWGRRADQNLPQVLDEVSSIGYAGIETGLSPFERFPNAGDLLKNRNVSLAGIHMGVGSMDHVDKALKILHSLGGGYLIFSGAGGRENSPENYRRNSKFLEEAGRKASDLGVRVCYHNHWQEIINDAMGIRIICEETNPNLVSLCVDTYWVKCGGLSPVEFIERFRDRVVYLHLKDGTEEGMKRHEFTELGRGIIDFPAIMRAIEPLDVEWLVVEQDRTDKTPKESMEISMKYIKEVLKI